MVRIVHSYNNQEGTYVVCIDEARSREARIEQDDWNVLREKHGDVFLEDPFSILDEAVYHVRFRCLE